jgi:hypothetical protein
MKILNTCRLRILADLFIHNPEKGTKKSDFSTKCQRASVAPCRRDFSDAGHDFYDFQLKEIESCKGENLRALLYEMSTGPNPSA